MEAPPFSDPFRLYLKTPRTLAAIARFLGMKRDAALHKVQALTEAGLIDVLRDGDRILYRRSPDADMFDSTGSAAEKLRQKSSEQSSPGWPPDPAVCLEGD